MANFQLHSDAFDNGDAIPKQYSCDGEDLSPAMAWSDPPPGTQSFALIVDDPDAPSGLFRHWAAFDIDREATSIAIGAGNDQNPPFSQGRNDFGKVGYGGPCPPPGHGTHHYHFKLYALDVRQLMIGDNPSIEAVENEAQRHQIDVAELTGTYIRD